MPIEWSGYSWLQHERWGEVHPDKPNWWYDPSCSIIDSEGRLNLLTKSNPKYFPELDITSKVGIGLVSCTTPFKWGKFEIEAMLPAGKNLWPAFWLWSFDSWPPEIDVFEGYSNDNPNYFKFRLAKPFGFWNIQTNLHYLDGEKHVSIRSKTHYFGFKDPTRSFIKYSVVWTPDVVEFYYGNRRVRKITNRKILDQLNNTTLNVIINNSLTQEADIDSPPLSNFIIKSFTYTPYLPETSSNK